SLWTQFQDLLGAATPSSVGAYIGSGHVIKSLGSILLQIDVDRIATKITFKILNSHGIFEVLLGKLWLATTRAVHNYNDDTLIFKIGMHNITIPN
ncbi:hypothetical protein M422DRAFT_90002, partial [Sphaerobolus stellatus SS14]